MEILVYGAGAVGSVLGGMLSQHRHVVRLVGRSPFVDAATADGLRLKSSTGEYLVHPSASTSVSRGDAGSPACVLLTVKSHDVAAAVQTLAGVVSPETPLVCFQNGVAAEGVAAARFARVFGGVVRMTCSMVTPAHVSFVAGGRVIVGLHPQGADPFARTLAAAFTEAGFEGAASREITGDKWLKLAVNAQSVFHAVIETRDHDSNEFHELNVAILDETRRVFKAGKVRARSCDGRDPSIDEMIAELRRPRARRSDHGVKVHNSVWQDLYLRRRSLEAEYIHGPVIALGREHAVPTPYHTASLEIAQRCHRAGTGPESLRLTAVLGAVEAARGAR